VVKLKDTHTGNTLCTPKHPVTLPKVVYPKPNIHAALIAKVKGEEDKIASGLAALHEEDPTFLYVVDGELHQTIISAQGELHLEVVADRLRRRHNVHVELAEPRVKYRETIKGKGESKYRHKKQTGGAGQFAEVWMRIEPKPRDSRRGVHQVARRAERGPQFRAVRREGRAAGLHRRHHRRLPRDGCED
jgi:elongation factor G